MMILGTIKHAGSDNGPLAALFPLPLCQRSMRDSLAE
ncbi:hypothetical protein J2Y48_003969 [Mycoplana sp. BE70]|nr:hypothetical protein [Mycoplana sp. BE70]